VPLHFRHAVTLDVGSLLAIAERILAAEISLSTMRTFAATKVSALAAWSVLPTLQVHKRHTSVYFGVGYGSLTRAVFDMWLSSNLAYVHQVAGMDLLEVLLNTFGRHLLPAAARIAARLVDLLRATAFDPGMPTRAFTILWLDAI
jgi:hypothetical protein